MSGATAPTSPRPRAPSTPDERAHVALRSSSRALRSIAHALRATAFWSAALLPLAYVPFLAGLDVGHHAGPFLTLVALHLLSLVAGRDHARTADP